MKRYTLLAIAALVLSPACGDDDDDGDDKGASCSSVCEAVVAAGCEGGPPTMAECLEGCNLQQTACPAEMTRLFSCAKGKAFTCNARDEAVVAGCESQLDALDDCIAAPSASCVETCPAVLAPGCTNGPADQEECEEGCRAIEVSCPEQMAAVMDCVEDQTFTCDANDSPMVTSCEDVYEALYACADME